MRTELVIFDCDGVLVDSESIGIHVEAELISELGWEMAPDEVVERFMGRPDSYMQTTVEEKIGRPVPDFQERYEQRLFAAFRDRLKPVPGVVEALDRITIATCVASSGAHHKMELTLGLAGLWDRFQGRIFSATEVAHGKPAPDLFLHAANTMGVKPEACVVVEDSPAGVEAARAAGMRCIAYATGLVPVAELEGPDTVVIDDMTTVPDHL